MIFDNDRPDRDIYLSVLDVSITIGKYLKMFQLLNRSGA